MHLGHGILGLWLCCLGVDAIGATPAAADFEQRLQQASQQLLGRPYRFSPLGEAQGPDPDPLWRTDAFDCTTYVETVLAMALSQGPDARLAELTRIRYRDNRIDFTHRRHLPAFQWLPDLQAMGLLQDITAQLGGEATQWLDAQISPASWEARAWRILRDLPASAVPSKNVTLPYLPLRQAESRLAPLQETALLSVVHQAHEGAPLLISHQALLVPVEDGHRVRHARSGDADRVVEEPLREFLARLGRKRYWPAIGINVADFVDPAVK